MENIMALLTLNLSDWADVATIFGATAIGAAAIQALIMYRQLTADHERGRREKTVDLLTEWFSRQKEQGPIARKIAEGLTEAQCRELLAQQSICVPIKLEKQLKQFFGNGEELKYDESGKEIEISDSQSTKLRWEIVCYLNSLETILIAWQYSIVDREIIETQFSYLFKPTEGHEILREFRVAAGNEDTYPAIEIFTTHLKNKRREKLTKKANIA